MQELTIHQIGLVSGGVTVHIGTDGVWAEGKAEAYLTTVKEGWNWLANNFVLSTPAMTKVAMLQLSRWARE